MTYTLSTTDAQVFTALRAFIIDALGPGVEVVRALDNRVPNPAGPFILISELFRSRIAMNETNYVDTPTVGQTPGVHTETATAATNIAFQFDCYGNGSSDHAQILANIWKSHLAVDFLSSYNMAPLFNDDPRKMPIINGENQYELRWTFTAHLQVNPGVTTSREFSDTPPSTEVVNVSALYPIT